MRAAGADADAVKEVQVAAGTQAENLADAHRLSAINAKVFGVESKKAAVSIEEATEASKLYAAQLGIAAGRITSVGDVQRQNAEQMLEWAEAAAVLIEGAKAYSEALDTVDYKNADLNAAVTAMGKFNSKAFALTNMAQDINESFAALGDTLVETTEDGQQRIELTGDVATEAGRAQQDAIEGVARALELQFADAYEQAGGSLKKFRDNAKEIGDATLARLHDELGLTDDEVELLRDQLNLTEGDYEARFKLSGTEEAQLKLDLLQTSIDDLPKNVETKVTQKIIAGDYVGRVEDRAGLLRPPGEPAARPAARGPDDLEGTHLEPDLRCPHHRRSPRPRPGRADGGRHGGPHRHRRSHRCCHLERVRPAHDPGCRARPIPAADRDPSDDPGRRHRRPVRRGPHRRGRQPAHPAADAGEALMPVPSFDFTTRATPVVQMGRSERRDTGNRWGEGTWGSGLWGVVDWEVIWSDLTCEVHEITTNTGRGGATDRFVPGTATIVASNVNQVSEMIFPRVPETGEGFEFVPQPPIAHEEDLQAPNATTVVSDGWKFTDDFEPPRRIGGSRRRGPRPVTPRTARSN